MKNETPESENWFDEWCRIKVGISPETARKYMFIAEHKDLFTPEVMDKLQAELSEAMLDIGVAFIERKLAEKS